MRRLRVIAAAAAIIGAAAVLLATHVDASDGATAASLAWDKAYDAGDSAALGALYDSDAVSMGPGLPALAGRAAIEADFRKFFAANRSRHETLAPVHIASGDIVVERGRYTMTTTPKDGGKPSSEKGKHIVIWHKGDDGQWRVKWEIWNTD